MRKEAGEPLGLEVSSAVFDRVRTCDNHCAFCFIYQLPKGMRRSLYLKDDDYRLSFLYGNFTTLTRFTELDAERVLEERLGPLFVSIHATDPAVRAEHAAQPQGGHQPALAEDPAGRGHRDPRAGGGLSRGERRGRSWTTPLPASSTSTRDWPRSAWCRSGLSDYSNEPEMRPHTPAEAAAVCDTVDRWQDVYHSVLGRRLVFAADEYYLLADRAAARGRGLRRLPPARERHRHGPGLRAEPSTATRPPPRGSGTASSPGSTAPRPRATGPRAWPAADGARHRGAGTPPPTAGHR